MELPNEYWRAGYTEESYAHHLRIVRAWKLAFFVMLFLAAIAVCTH